MFILTIETKPNSIQECKMFEENVEEAESNFKALFSISARTKCLSFGISNVKRISYAYVMHLKYVHSVYRIYA